MFDLLQNENPSPPLKVLDLGSFLSTPLPPREYLVRPILPSQGLGILYAPRGLGKTYLALSIALAVASGGMVFDWRAPQSKRVMYVDGEMPAVTMQERLAALVNGMAIPSCALQNLKIITPDLQPIPMPDLSTARGHALMEPHLSEVDLVIIDNIATLCRTGKENEAQSWQNMQAWLLDLRRRGLAVLLVHHAGKSGDQRGTSAREDIMDTIISLRRPKLYNMAQGARFELHLTKARNLTGEDADPFEAHLHSEGEALYWVTSKLEDVNLEEVRKLLAEEYSVRDIAKEMGMSKSAVWRIKKKLEEGA